MPDEQDVQSFMQAVYEIGKQYKGWADAEQIMTRLDLEMSIIKDPAHNPTTDDDETYRDLVRYCEDEERGYIKSVDRYASVRITKRGTEYVESGFTRL
jgi:hypothetical protein